MSNRPARLPPLTALRAFDAAARHMSFAKAADELAVTPAALSYQIKSLEEDLDVQLFRRLNRAVELTEAGKALAPGLATAAGDHGGARLHGEMAGAPALSVRRPPPGRGGAPGRVAQDHGF